MLMNGEALAVKKTHQILLGDGVYGKNSNSLKRSVSGKLNQLGQMVGLVKI